mgnify:CR=1 FL=1
MAVCFFNKNYTEKYKCNYEIKDTIIKIEAEYDITEEIEAINGVKFFGSKFRKRRMGMNNR